MRTAGDTLRLASGVTASIAPLLHSITDAMEWYQGGFSPGQLWLNYIAFVPMTWLLLAIYASHDPKPGALGLIGALMYGAAFTYFSHTTLIALDDHVANYELLWDRLGTFYTVHGALMVVGGLMFALAVFRAGWLPRYTVYLFACGLAANLILSLLPAPDILQTVGSLVRNTGLVGMGYFLILNRWRQIFVTR